MLGYKISMFVLKCILAQTNESIASPVCHKGNGVLELTASVDGFFPRRSASRRANEEAAHDNEGLSAQATPKII